MITNETKFIIQKVIDELTTAIAESAHMGLCEDMSPNDPEFYPIYEKNLEEAQAFIIAELNGENEPAKNEEKVLAELSNGEDPIYDAFHDIDEAEEANGKNYDECKGY